MLEVIDIFLFYGELGFWVMPCAFHSEHVPIQISAVQLLVSGVTGMSLWGGSPSQLGNMRFSTHD